jgi:hypothetical protein
MFVPAIFTLPQAAPLPQVKFGVGELFVILLLLT